MSEALHDSDVACPQSSRYTRIDTWSPAALAKEMEGQRGALTCTRTQSQWGPEPGFTPEAT